MRDDIAERFRMADKGQLGYLPAYQRLAAEIGPAGHVLEVGVREGESLRLWQALFPDGIVAGADNHAEGLAQWPESTRVIIEHQDSPHLPTRAHEESPGGYDLIVDDASHDGKLSQAHVRSCCGRW